MTTNNNKEMSEMQKDNGIWGMLGKILEALAPIVLVGLITWCAWATQKFNHIEVRIGQIDEWRAMRPQFVTTSELQAALLKSLQDVDSNTGARLDQIHLQLRELQKEVTTFTVLLGEHVKLQVIKP